MRSREQHLFGELLHPGGVFAGKPVFLRLFEQVNAIRIGLDDESVAR
jgi:hypothetical protein